MPFCLVDAGNDHEVAVEIVSRDDVGQCLADEVGQFFNAFFFHEMRQAAGHVLDDPVAVFHDGQS